MGKASSRKRLALPRVEPAAVQAESVQPGNNPDAARALLEAYDVLAKAQVLVADLGEALVEMGPKSARNARNLKHLALCIGDVKRGLLEPHVAPARHLLGLGVSYAGMVGRANDGAAVKVDIDGFVQHTAPDDVLRDVGLLPVKAGKAKGGAPK